MDKLRKEQAAIDKDRAALEERQARIKLLEELTPEQKAAIETVFREEDVVASTSMVAKKREMCTSPGCGREFLPSGVKRHIQSAHPDDAEHLQLLIDERRVALG